MVVKRDLSTAIKVPRSREAIQFISCQWPINNSRQETELRRAGFESNFEIKLINNF